MTDLPLTRIPASQSKQQLIRNAVTNTERQGEMARIARASDTAALTELLSDPEISQVIYTLPTQINHDTVGAFIDQHLDERERGEGLLMLSGEEGSPATAYYDIQVWPQWAACELGGAISSKHQNTGRGGSGALDMFSWLFDVIGVDLICETAALDNVRTAKLLNRIGFTYMGEIESKLAGGGQRPSHYWELNRADWCQIQSSS